MAATTPLHRVLLRLRKPPPPLPIPLLPHLVSQTPQAPAATPHLADPTSSQPRVATLTPPRPRLLPYPARTPAPAIAVSAGGIARPRWAIKNTPWEDGGHGVDRRWHLRRRPHPPLGEPHQQRQIHLLQALLRGRFLWNGGLPEEDRRPPSTAKTELRQLRQRHPISGLRLENIVRGQAVSQSDASSTQNVEVSTNGHSEPVTTYTEYTLDRHQRAGLNVGLQQIECAAVVLESGSNTPSEFLCISSDTRDDTSYLPLNQM